MAEAMNEGWLAGKDQGLGIIGQPELPFLSLWRVKVRPILQFKRWHSANQ